MIFVTGCARSGTSLTTKILEAHGVDIGRGRASVNSLYENTDIREKVVKPYLREIGVDPLGQNPLPDEKNLPPAPYWRGQILNGMCGPKEPWAYKCAKLVLIWPLWEAHFPGAKYIIVRRDKEKIIDSCMRAGFMRNHKNREGWGIWVDEHLRRMEDMKNTLGCIEIWPDRYISDPWEFKPVADFCGLEFNPKAVADSVDRGNWHG